MKQIEKILADHKRKSNQVRKLKKKLQHKAKTTLSLSILEGMLRILEEHKMNHFDPVYQDNDEKFIRDEATREARKELLNELIFLVKTK